MLAQMSKLEIRGKIEVIQYGENIVWILSPFTRSETILESPDFIFASGLCCLRLEPKRSDTPRLCVLYLKNAMPREYSVKFEVGWKKPDGNVEEIGTGRLNEGEIHSNMIEFKLFDLVKQISTEVLSITCRLKREGTNPPEPPKRTFGSGTIPKQALLHFPSSLKGPLKETFETGTISKQEPLQTPSSSKDLIDSLDPVPDALSDSSYRLLQQVLEIYPENFNFVSWMNILLECILGRTGEEYIEPHKDNLVVELESELLFPGQETSAPATGKKIEKEKKGEKTLENCLKEREIFEKICQENNYFATDKRKSAAIQATNLICYVLSPEELRKLNAELQTEGADKRSIFLREVKFVKKQLELEKEKFCRVSDSADACNPVGDTRSGAGYRFAQQYLKQIPEKIKVKLWEKIVEYSLGRINKIEKETSGKESMENYLKEKERLVKISQKNKYFTSDERKSAGILATALLCHVLSPAELRKLNDELETEGANMKDIFRNEVKSVKKQLELEKEKFSISAEKSAENSCKEDASLESSKTMSETVEKPEEFKSVLKQSAEVTSVSTSRKLKKPARTPYLLIDGDAVYVIRKRESAEVTSVSTSRKLQTPAQTPSLLIECPKETSASATSAEQIQATTASSSIESPEGALAPQSSADFIPEPLTLIYTESPEGAFAPQSSADFIPEPLTLIYTDVDEDPIQRQRKLDDDAVYLIRRRDDLEEIWKPTKDVKDDFRKLTKEPDFKIPPTLSEPGHCFDSTWHNENYFRDTLHDTNKQEQQEEEKKKVYRPSYTRNAYC